MPLSTSMPKEMISAAIDTRCNSTPLNRMMMIASSMVSGTAVPTISPVRSPRKTITMTSTMVIV